MLPVAAAALALLAGCGDGDGGGSSELAELVPPDAPVYAELAFFPDDERSDAIASLTERIGGISDPEERIISLIDAGFEEGDTGLTYAEDVEPWLGDEAALFVRSFQQADLAAGMADAAYLTTVSDVDAAEGFVDELAAADSRDEVEEREYEGVSYMADPSSDTSVGIVDEVMVVGTEPAFKSAVDASGGNSLADSDDFAELVGPLDDDALAEAWIDVDTAFDAAAATATEAEAAEIDAARTVFEPLLSEPIAARLEATEENVALEVSSAGTGGMTGSSELLGALPAGAWFAVATEDYGAAVGEQLETLGSIGAELGDPSVNPEAIISAVEQQTGLDLEEDVLSWIGDVSAFVGGTGAADFQAGVLVGTSDAEATRKVLDTAEELFEAQTGLRPDESGVEGAEDGFAATGPGGATVDVALAGDELVGALGEEGLAQELLDPVDPLSDDPLYTAALEALGNDVEATLFVGLQDFLVVAEQGDDGDTDYDAARPYTQALEYFAFGSAEEDGRERSRFVLGVGE
jgi:hypothetical protein